jgi:hypothetical protein
MSTADKKAPHSWTQTTARIRHLLSAPPNPFAMKFQIFHGRTKVAEGDEMAIDWYNPKDAANFLLSAADHRLRWKTRGTAARSDTPIDWLTIRIKVVEMDEEAEVIIIGEVGVRRGGK